MYRVQLTKNTPAKNPVCEKILLVKDFESLVKQASGKFNIKPHKLRLFVAVPLFSAKVGTEITNNDELQKIFCNDMMLAVSNGEDFKRKTFKSKEVSEDLLSKIKKPPRFPYPTKIAIDQINQVVQVAQAHQRQKESQTQLIPYSVDLKATNYTKNQNNNFPIFEGNVLGLIRKTIERFDKIIQTDCNGFVSFDYDDDMIFPEVKSWDDLLIRECRGLIVSTVTGKVLARRFHKFFNINEKIESDLETIVNHNYSVYEKLDGTLTSPILLDDGTDTIVWATRKAINTDIENFVLNNEIDYNTFCKKMLQQNITPIFEYCHDTIAVSVLCYPTKQLILTALRNNINGNYLSIDNVTEVPIVKKMEVDTTNINKIISDTKDKVGTEGVVIYTDKGNLYKCKSSWYVSIVSAQNLGQNGFLLEYVKKTGSIANVPLDKIFISAILNSDDIMAEVYTLLTEKKLSNQSRELRNFVQIVQKNILLLESELKDWIKSSFKIIQDNDTILSIAENAGWDPEMINDLFSNKSITQKLKSFLCLMSKRQKVYIVAELLNIGWNSSKCIIDLQNQVLDIVTFEQCDDEIRDHVLQKYIPRKLCNLIGSKHVFDESIINIPDSYMGNEGKILGLHEHIADKFGIFDLRVDLQAPRKEYNGHNGNSEYALFLVQSGKSNDKSISYAGVMVPTSSDNTFCDILTAFRQSFETHKLIKLKRKTKLDTNFKIFCDLDGVLVDFERGIFELTGKPIENQTTSKMWQRVANCPNFFERLEFTTYGKQMWEDINIICNSVPIILTGIPSSTKRRYDIEKQNWCHTNLGDHVNVITCNSSDKHKFASNNHVLIDDRIEIGRQWTESGGTFIHHITPERTIYELSTLFNKHLKLKMETIETSACDKFVSKFTPADLSIVTNVWNLEIDEMVTIDSEWKHNSTENPVSIVQIATQNNVYLIDMINASAVIKEQLYDLLTNKKILKLCFGMSEIECWNIGSDINNVIDLQEVCKNHYDNFNQGYLPSLSFVTASMLKKYFGKTKEIQLSDWDIRPLSFEQMMYAIEDVEILFHIYDKLKHFNVPPKTIHSPKSMSSASLRKNKLEYDTNIPVTILFKGIFLTHGAKHELLSIVKPIYQHMHSECAVNMYLNLDSNIGQTVSFQAIEILFDENVQIVKCEYKKNMMYVVISSKTQLYDETVKSYIENIHTFEKVFLEKPIALFGIIGVMVQQELDELASIPEKIKNKILMFETTAETNESLKFKPNELSASERSTVHEYARNHNMNSMSTGTNTDRQLILTMKRKTENTNLKEMARNNEKEKFKVCDNSLFNLLSFVCANEINNSNSKKIKKTYEATIGLYELENISSNLKKKLDMSHKLIILRGLPGSGKSYLSNCFHSAEICSADDYFEINGEYKFDQTMLNHAHACCYNICVEYLHKKCPTVIIDNTNSTLKEYKKYIEAGNCFEYTIIVLQISAETNDMAKEFITRSCHNVPMNEGLKMLNRWETDDNAFVIEPYFPNQPVNIKQSNETLHQWLSNMKLYHFSKLRNKSHMVMAIGDKPATFLDIPDYLYDEFINRYSNAIECGESVYLMEYSARFNEFRFFVDFDYVGDMKLTLDEITEYSLLIQNIVKKYNPNKNCDMYVTGCIEKCAIGFKSGLHLKFPNIMVNKFQAFEIINECEAQFDLLDNTKNWDLVFDKCVYGDNCGVRMIFSRKTTNAIDVGRVHNLLFAFDTNSMPINLNFSTPQLVRLLSIYNK